MTRGTPVLKTSRLRLRTHTPADVDWLYSLYSRPEITRYLPFGPWTFAEAARQSAERVEKSDLAGERAALVLVVEVTGQPIGEVLLWMTDRDHGIAEMGWVLDDAHQGRGYAREAASAVLTHAFEEHSCHRVAARLDPRNTASARVAGALGMRQEGHLREDFWKDGEYSDTLIFAVLRSDVTV